MIHLPISKQKPYLVVTLDEACRKQQLGEGWFPSLDDVQSQAISMSVRQILKSKKLIVSVPDERKAAAVTAAVTDHLLIPARHQFYVNTLIVFLY